MFPDPPHEGARNLLNLLVLLMKKWKNSRSISARYPFILREKHTKARVNSVPKAKTMSHTPCNNNVTNANLKHGGECECT